MRLRLSGFTLVELMVVVTVVAILSAIAIPNYRNYVMRSQRSAATTALMRIQAAQEKFFLQNNAYAANLAAAPPLGLGIAATTDDGHYDLVLTPGVGAAYDARADAIGSQLDDTRCQRFTINQNGVRRAFDSGSTDRTAECWR